MNFMLVMRVESFSKIAYESLLLNNYVKFVIDVIYTSFKRTVTQAILKINACFLNFAISYFFLLSQPLFVPACLKMSTEKARV